MASTSSLGFSSKTTYDVFLSFSGIDTRSNFTDHLHVALRRRSLTTFIDDVLERGEGISPALMKAIEESMISVVILFENYASSRWCLDELVKIIDCKKGMGRKVLPIFYHVDPSDVRKQTGKFGEAFGKVKEKFKQRLDIVEKWSTALMEAANLSGWDSKNYRLESKLIDKVVNQIMKKLYPISFSACHGLVGIDAHVNKILPLLCIETADVRFIGIWGMGGIGKTTTTDVLFSQISDEFDVCYFLSNVGENAEKNELLHLRQKLFSELVGDKLLSIQMLHVLPTIVLDILRRKKVFIVLDDVNDSEQLEALAGYHGWYGSGSRVIVTSRDKEVLVGGVDQIYKVEGLNYCDALQLLSVKAFKQEHPPEEFMKFAERVVNYAKGVPLALKVLGSHLCKRSPKEWEIVLKELKKIPISKIHKILKISFDSLEQTEKAVFLDIACFFKGQDKDCVEDILDGCDLTPSLGIIRLVEKCLVIVVNNKLEMHDLIQEMVQHIARHEHSRLWEFTKICDILATEKVNKAVEGICLDTSKMGMTCLNSATFSQMPNLRLLKFFRHSNKKDSTPETFILESLSLLHWEEYPYSSLPLCFSMENLVLLNLEDSDVKRLWHGDQCPQKLKYLYLSGSKKLATLPNLSSATNLERIDLKACESLLEIPSSIQFLHKLNYLNLDDCINLRNLPSLLHLKNLKELSLSFCINLKKMSEIPSGIKQLDLICCGAEEWSASVQSFDTLKYMHISMCKNLRGLPSSLHLTSVETLKLFRCSNLNKFPNVTGYLKRILLEEVAIEELPSTIGCLFSLVELKLEKCNKLESLPGSICELKCLEGLFLRGCSKLGRLPSLCGLCSLTHLYLDDTAVSEIPSDIFSLSSLRLLSLNNCKRLQHLPELPERTTVLQAFNCTSLETVKSPLPFALVPKCNGCRRQKGIFNYCNCFNLEHNTLGNILTNARLRIEEKFGFSEFIDSFLVGLPGTEIPEWFSYENLGSSIAFVFPPKCINAKYLYLAFCVVLEFKVPLAMEKYNNFVLACELHLKNADGNEVPLIMVAPKIYHDNVHFGAAIESDHVFLWHNRYCIKRWLKHNCSDVNKLSIESEFKVDNLHKGNARHIDLVESKVKRCGIHLLYAFKDEEYQCSPSTIQTKLSLQYSSAVSNFMQQVRGNTGFLNGFCFILSCSFWLLSFWVLKSFGSASLF
ncbi:hypothetical protein P3X46_021617 [Hevea brasiliensis]|uniref:ADP-ribosyl cyclase/cyclic ADP-ribose hydrolase n=1 Tax=Hevea brasiliensis TaxID=3981 RepID=A0ABQ9LJY3_HEVBR|nr:hypothetical protein P3X46_021617 [Hevea brasiliensis]